MGDISLVSHLKMERFFGQLILMGHVTLVTLNQKTVWVTSSVYEIEIGHFVGCKVHELQNKDGKIVQSIELPSKAWSLEGRGFDCIIGLGRPEPGVYSVLSQNGKLTSVTETPNLPIVRSVASGNGYISFLTASEVAFEINPDGYLHNTEHNATCVGYRHDGQWLTSARIKEIYGQEREKLRSGSLRRVMWYPLMI